MALGDPLFAVLAAEVREKGNTRQPSATCAASV